MMQLLTSVVPSLEKLQKEEGEAGRRREITKYTRYLTLFWAVSRKRIDCICLTPYPFHLEY